MDYGIQVDIQSIRRYCINFGKNAARNAPLKFMGQDVELRANLVKILFGEDDVEALKKKRPTEKYDAAADETFPAVKGSKKEHLAENRTRKALGEKHKQRFGRSFTLASSYH